MRFILLFLFINSSLFAQEQTSIDNELLILQEQLKSFSDSLILNQVELDTIDHCIKSDSITSNGISLEKEPLANFLQQNKGKNYFIYLGAVWCGPCKKIKNITFKDSLFVSFYKKNIVGIELDIESFSGIELSQKYKIEQIPQFLFFNTKSVLVGRIEGYMETYSFIKKIKSFY